MSYLQRLIETGVVPETAKELIRRQDEALQAAVEEATMDRDTTGGVVPTYKAHTYTYDGSGNLKTDTVGDGTNTWVRTYGWTNGVQTSDSGWVKQ